MTEMEIDPIEISESILIIDFGSQYSQLIARRVRESKVYCEIVPHDVTQEAISYLAPKGIILSGGPASVYDKDAPMCPSWIYEMNIPILGICYGLQVLAHELGGSVVPSTKKEYGHALLHQIGTAHPLFKGLPDSINVWMSHGDQVEQIPEGFKPIAYTDNSPVAAIGDETGKIGLQFHPEVIHTPDGKQIIENFLYLICGLKGTWTPKSFITESITRIQSQVGESKVICGISGGVDSSVTAALIHRAIGDQLTCIFVNNGLLRQGEPEEVISILTSNMGINLIYSDAVDQFLSKLNGIIDPERKRKIIGNEFIEVFEEEASKLGTVEFLAQGTLYPDVIESKSDISKNSVTIKTHHNVGGLPEDMKFSLVEPLRYLFKDEVRDVGLELGLPENMIYRQPFPGPGLAIRIIGEVTHEKLEILKCCDTIVTEEIHSSNLYKDLWQSFAVLTDTRTVGVMGDFRTYGYMVAIRAVTSEDAMTADWARIPYNILAKISSRIVNEVESVNRVVYDITSKPPGTIEWE
jgi:GMP synthase (glutamine-hydrolysing)